MVALRTGWTPDVLAELPLAFRRACHWAIYAESIVGNEGLQQVQIPHGAPPLVRAKAQAQVGALLQLRSIIFPDD